MKNIFEFYSSDFYSTRVRYQFESYIMAISLFLSSDSQMFLKCLESWLSRKIINSICELKKKSFNQSSKRY